LVDSSINHMFGTAVAVLHRPADAAMLMVQVEVASFRYRPGIWSGQTVTFVNSTNHVVLAAHGFLNGEGPLRLVNSGGGLPTGLTAGTDYWVIERDAGTFQLAANRQNAMIGVENNQPGAQVPVAFTTNGTGTNTIQAIAAVPTVAVTTGQGSLILAARTEPYALSAPRVLTLDGFGVTAINSWWWL